VEVDVGANHIHRKMAVAEVCASCPESFHDEASKICLSRGIQKAFGKAGDMVNSLSGKDWVAKWEAKVVTAVVTKATTLGSSSARIICIAGGRHCDSEMAAQPRLVKAIKQEMENPDFRVRVEWMEFDDFRTDMSHPQSGKTPTSAGGGGEQQKSGKDSFSGATKLCKYFSTAAGCKNGKDCTFLHVAETPADGSADKKSGGKSQGKGKNKSSDSTPKHQQNGQKNQPQPEKHQQQKQQPPQKENQQKQQPPQKELPPKQQQKQQPPQKELPQKQQQKQQPPQKEQQHKQQPPQKEQQQPGKKPAQKEQQQLQKEPQQQQKGEKKPKEAPNGSKNPQSGGSKGDRAHCFLRCPGCERGFASGEALRQHFSDTGHDALVLGPGGIQIPLRLLG